MKFWKVALLAVGMFASIQVVAQKKGRQYYNTYWEKVAKEKADYYGTEELLISATPVVKVTRYFIDTDIKQSEVHFAADDFKSGKEVKSGKYLIWNKNGQLVLKQNFINNKRNDSLITYHESGKVRRIELYENGKMLEGTVFAADGAVQPYYPYEEKPQFPGGEKAMFTFIAQNMKYPRKAIDDKVSGSVLVSFVIDKDGRVINTGVKKSVHPALDAEAMRVVEDMPKWKPGTQEGEPIPVLFSLPLKFTLK